MDSKTLRATARAFAKKNNLAYDFVDYEEDFVSYTNTDNKSVGITIGLLESLTVGYSKKFIAKHVVDNNETEDLEDEIWRRGVVRHLCST